MSQVTRIDCVLCTPSAGDLQGIRRPIAGGITSEELSKLIQHIIAEHTPAIGEAKVMAELADDHARVALNVAQRRAAPPTIVVDAPEPVNPTISDPARQLEGMTMGEPLSQGTIDGYKASE